MGIDGCVKERLPTTAAVAALRLDDLAAVDVGGCEEAASETIRIAKTLWRFPRAAAYPATKEEGIEVRFVRNEAAAVENNNVALKLCFVWVR